MFYTHPKGLCSFFLQHILPLLRSYGNCRWFILGWDAFDKKKSRRDETENNCKPKAGCN